MRGSIVFPVFPMQTRLLTVFKKLCQITPRQFLYDLVNSDTGEKARRGCEVLRVSIQHTIAIFFFRKSEREEHIAQSYLNYL